MTPAIAHDDDQWEKMYQELADFRKVHGHYDVFEKGADTKDRKEKRGMSPLGQWVLTQRNNYEQKNEELLDGVRIERLESIGFTWKGDLANAKLNKVFGRLCAYKDQYGDCFVPKTYPADQELASWVSWHRKLFRQGALREDRKKMLDSIGFLYELPSASVPSAKEVLEEKYQEEEDHYVEHGSFFESLYEKHPTIDTAIPVDPSQAAASDGHRPDTSNLRDIFLSDAPLMDVRAPVEFKKGCASSACCINVPLMNDEERHVVGTCFKEHGREAAIKMGNELVMGASKEARLQQWAEFARANPTNGYLYCFRGGLRSQTVQRWLKNDAGIHYPLVKGGSKAMRRFLLDELERSLDTTRTEIVIVAGKTGSGKTRVIDQLGPQRCIDLEGLAHHRGSAFGAMPEDPDQPSQIDFENSVSIAFLKLLASTPTSTNKCASDQQQIRRVFIEDEGNRIGHLIQPSTLWDRMTACRKIIIIEEDLEERVNVISQDYILDLGRRFNTLYGKEKGPALHRERLLGDLKRLRKLRGERLDQLVAIMEAAFDEQVLTGDISLHREWIVILLEQYYDSMYEHQLTQHGDNCEVLFRGTRQDAVEWGLANC